MDSPEAHKHCLNCGYIVDELAVPRCPECGRVFNPDDPKTYFTEAKCGWWYLMGIGGAYAGLAATLGVVILMRTRTLTHGEFACLISGFILLIGSIILGAWVSGSCQKALDLPPAATCHRSCLWLDWCFGLPFWILLVVPIEITGILIVVLAGAAIASC